MPAVNRDALSGRWETLCRALGTPAARRAAFDRLFAAYTGADRHYHDIGHIDSCLRELDGVHQLASRPDAIELAIWFHDAVYDATRTDNEERSADVARAMLGALGADEALVEQVAQLVLFTRHDQDPETTDGRLTVDIDLASLALPPEQFDQNSRRIRLEFAHVPDADFRHGRRQMLERFLNRRHIYYTDVFRQRCESAARANLQRIVGSGG